MFVAMFLALAISQSASTTEASTFSDGPLQISAAHLATSFRTPEGTDTKLWTCDAAGESTIQYGDIQATADSLSVSQTDLLRHQFSLRGSARLSIRNLSAKADKISWSMDDRPMVLSGNATITLGVDGKLTTVSSEKIVFDHSENKLILADGTIRGLPVSKVHALSN
ncbi:LptA/OstA family protein [Bremerella sp.]|uniref:LptA/OstA family protein n=1 Tax=Bremerella sp. TaxID=2795602 RepID=UPI003919A033